MLQELEEQNRILNETHQEIKEDIRYLNDTKRKILLILTKDLGHFWLGYIRMLRRPQMSDYGYRHLVIGKCPTYFVTFLLHATMLYL